MQPPLRFSKAVARSVPLAAFLGLSFSRIGSASAVKDPKRGAKYWAKMTGGFDFSDADRVPPARFNRVLWRGVKGGKPYPASISACRVAMNRD